MAQLSWLIILSNACNAQLFMYAMSQQRLSHYPLPSQSWWQQENTCRIARLYSTRSDSYKINSLFFLIRVAIHHAIAIVIGHCPLGRHAEKLGILFKDCRRSFQIWEREKNIFPPHVSVPYKAKKEMEVVGFLLSRILERPFRYKGWSHGKVYIGLRLV